MIRLVIIFILFSFSTQSHHWKPDQFYDCKLVARGILDGSFAGGDGKFGSEAGSFKANYFNDGQNKNKKAIVMIHGDRFTGGKMYLDWDGDGKTSLYATILNSKSLEELPYSTLKSKNNVDDTILWLSAFRSNYKRSVFMTFVRGTLRYSTYYNHPTRAVAQGEHGFLDCKLRK